MIDIIYRWLFKAFTDNKVIIKILASNDMLERIVSYKVKFTDSKNNTLDREVWKLSTCSSDDTEEARCFSVDYIDLKNAILQILLLS